jgi:uncharacterized protein (DUF1800 family)
LLASPTPAGNGGGNGDARTIGHVLNRITFGPRPGDIERVKAMGLEAYIEQQLHPAQIDDSSLERRLDTFQTLDMSTQELAEKYYIPAVQLRRANQRAQARASQPSDANPQMSGESMTPTPQAGEPPPPSPEVRQAQAAQALVISELMQARMLRAVLSERQLQEVMADFWLNHFNVFVGKGQVRQYLNEYDRDVIRPNSLGEFRDLLGAVAHSPAMLFYLDNWQSSGPAPAMNGGPRRMEPLRNPRPGLIDRQRMLDPAQPAQQQRPARGLNENYARELMELHTLGVDAGYTQKDVVELARILTGWTIDRPQQGGRFIFRPAMHDNGTKTFLGATMAPAGESEGERALDLLARHPATARHISFKLAQRFVADEPPAALVERAAKTFLETHGNIRDVVRVIVTSPELLDATTYRAKIKTPLEFVASAVRATGAQVIGAQPLVVALRNLGMPLYGAQPPTGYSMTADAWVNTGALLNRMNVAIALTSGGRIQPIEGPGRGGQAVRRPDGNPEMTPTDRPVPAPQRPARAAEMNRRQMLNGPIQMDLARLAPDATEASRHALTTTILGGDVSDVTRQTLARATSPRELVSLVLGSPEFQRR